MKKQIILSAILAAGSASAEPLRIRNERAIEERAERAAIRAAATEAVAELIRRDKLPPEKVAAVVPLFPTARHGLPFKTGDVVVVDGKVGVVKTEIAAKATEIEIKDSIEIKSDPIDEETKDTNRPDIGPKIGGK